MTEPGSLARRVMVAGLDIAPMCSEASVILNAKYGGTLMWDRFVQLHAWQKVEILLGAYECLHWSVEMPEADPVERALWCVAREMGMFHMNVLCQNNS